MHQSTSYTVTDRNIIVAKGSKKAMQHKRAELGKNTANPCTGFEERMSNGRLRFGIWLSLTSKIGDKLN